MKAIKHIGIFFLLLVFLAGTTGVSFLHHICSSSKQDIVTVYPEIFKRSGSSCCAEESTGYACASHVNLSKDKMPLNIDGAPCCKSIASFIKLEILTIRVAKLVIHPEKAQLPVSPTILCQIPAFEQPLLQPAHFQFYSPPLFGRLLVHYLHQMKIPAHTCIA
jgi:hypothetical protein